MSEELREMQREIVGAVQEQLTRFSTEVAASLKQINEEAAAAKAARESLESQVQSLASAVETQSHTVSSAIEQQAVAGEQFRVEVKEAVEGRLNEYASVANKRHEDVGDRLAKVVDESNNGMSAAVEAAAAPLFKKVEARQDQMSTEISNLGESLQRFDEQAGQMVDHINSVTTAIEGRFDRISTEMTSSFEDRVSSMVIRIDEVSAAAARQQADVNNIVNSHVDASEQRVNDRMLAVEGRLNEEIGQRVADIDAHVGRVGAGLDDSVAMLSDRIAANDSRFADFDAEFVQLREELGSVDAEAIDEMKDKISSALGQAELVRIDMDRFQESMRENHEAVAVRLTEIETTVQDQSMDVESAVQLERLEEVERAVLMLDPDILERHDDAPAATPAAPARPDDPAGFPGETVTPEPVAAPAPAPEPEPTPEPVAVAAAAPQATAVAAEPAPASAATANPAPAPASGGIEMPKMPSLSELTGDASQPLSQPTIDDNRDSTVAMVRPPADS